MKFSRAAMVVSIVCLLLAASFPAAAQQAEAAPSVVINITAEGVEIPAELPEGVITVTFANQTEVPAGPLLARLNEDVTLDAFMEALSGGPMAALPLVSLQGGVQVMPGESTDVTFDFQPGSYIALSLDSEVPGVQPFTVTDDSGEGAAAPEADVAVSLYDFAFSLPLEIPAGAATWQIENKGEQWHEMGIFRVDDDLTIREFRDVLSAVAAGEDTGEPPVAFWAPMDQGERAWLTLDLEPGTYVVACFLPDFGSGHAHIDLGMVQIINVTA